MTDPTNEMVNEGHRLTALLGAVDSVGSVDEAAWVLAEWIAEAFEAEVVGVLVDGEVVASLGGSDVELEEWRTDSERSGIRTSSLGDVHLHAAAVRGVKGTLVVGRVGAQPLTASERNLLRGVTRVAGLVLRLLHAFELQVRLRLEDAQA